MVEADPCPSMCSTVKSGHSIISTEITSRDLHTNPTTRTEDSNAQWFNPLLLSFEDHYTRYPAHDASFGNNMGLRRLKEFSLFCI